MAASKYFHFRDLIVNFYKHLDLLWGINELTDFKLMMSQGTKILFIIAWCNGLVL